MLIAIFGESCTGKSTLANKLNERLQGKIYSGKDYLRLAKSESQAKQKFINLLEVAVCGGNVIYVIAQKEHLAFLPNGSIRVLVSAPLDVILERFSVRMRGVLPPPVKNMLVNSHGIFDNEVHDIHYNSSTDDLNEICKTIFDRISQ